MDEGFSGRERACTWVEKRKRAEPRLKITQFVTRDRLCSIGEAGDRRNCGHDLSDRQRDGNQSKGVQKAGRQEKKMVIGASAQFTGELSGRGFGARVVQRIQSDRR